MAFSHRYGALDENLADPASMDRMVSGIGSSSPFRELAGFLVQTPWRRLVINALKSLFFIAPWAFLSYYFFIPPSAWVHFEKVFVADGVVGGPSPKVTVSWRVERPFLMRWHTVLRQEEGSAFKAICWGQGASEQHPGRQLASDIDVDWWLTHGRCVDHLSVDQLQAGRYYIESLFEWDDFAFVRSTSIDSNVFTIK